MKLSVCIVTYNHEALIRQCIESVLRQRVAFDYEIVVGEDCSTDRTRAILEDLASQHPDKLKVKCRPKNLGAELNFNQTISECAGEYIAFLEGDNNWTADDKLRMQVAFLDDHPDAAFCCHRVGYVDEIGKRMPIVLPLADPPEMSDIGFLLQDSNPVGLGTIVARRELLEGLADWVQGLKMGDWPLCLMLATRGRIGFIGKEMSVQRVHSGGTWQKLPEAVQVAYMIHMLNRVGPKLPAALEPTIADMTHRFLVLFADRLFSGDSSLLPTILDRIEALNDKALLGQLMRFTIESKAAGRHRLLTERHELERLLAHTRKQPWQAVRDLIVFRFSSYMARQHLLFSPRRREKIGTSASKRDPERGLHRYGKAYVPAPTGGSAAAAETVGRRIYNPAFETILVVSHDATRTGAPILALNIAQNLAKRYNVVWLVLRGGDLLEEFEAASIEIVLARRFSFVGGDYLPMIRSLTNKHKFLFAIVNSMESRGVLQGLHECGVPIVSLIHEFSSYSNPKTAALDFFRLSDQTIFSTKITLDNALLENNLLTARGLHVLPQGKCAIPKPVASDVRSDDEIAWLTSMLRPSGESGRSFVVIGAGTVSMRKGVDLFIEVATRVLSGPGGERFRFAWIGAGYDPDRDLAYSIYLRDQIRRAGIEDRMLLLNETSQIEAAYQLADVLMLSSRLDPLPNVAIDSLSIGKPVFCFDRTTGIAHILKENGLGEECVAAYLDTTEMARKISILAADTTLYASVSQRSRDLAAGIFDFGTYIDKLQDIATQAVEMAGKNLESEGH